MIEVYEEVENDIVHIGNQKISGFIAGECGQCNGPLVMHNTYDALFCPACNQWFEEKCPDNKCEFCATRPEKPLLPRL